TPPRAGTPTRPLASVSRGAPPHLVEAKRTAGPIDTIGLSLIAWGLGALEIVLSKGQESDWFTSGFITFFAIVSTAALVSFVIWEWRAKHPVVEVRLFLAGHFAIAALL